MLNNGAGLRLKGNRVNIRRQRVFIQSEIEERKMGYSNRCRCDGRLDEEFDVPAMAGTLKAAKTGMIGCNQFGFIL
jgi:hypothetical protein